MTWLITSDIHLSDRQRDSYRFDLFPWLTKQQKLYNTTATFILGDLTHEKDYHSARLVNRTIHELTKLKPPVYILRGNHDGLSPEWPFFEFLNCIDGFYFVPEPGFMKDLGVAFLPHCRAQAEFDEACAIVKPHCVTMTHQTFEGAVSESGRYLSGLKVSALERAKPRAVWAGDVHKPQQQGIVAYIGAPYQVRFGDDFEPRVILVTGKQQKDLHFDCLRKWSLQITDPKELYDIDLRKGDQVRVIVALRREEAVDWLNHKRMVSQVCKHLGLEVFGIDLKIANPKKEEVQGLLRQTATPQEVFTAFCKHEGLTDGLRNTGYRYITASTNTDTR